MPVRRATLPDDRALIDGVVTAAWPSDVASPLTEEALLDLEARSGGSGFIDAEDGVAVGYAHLRPDGGFTVAEVVVRPDGGEASVALLLNASLEEPGPRRLWALDDRLARCAGESGMTEVRALLHLACELPTMSAASPVEGVSLQRYEHERDLTGFLEMHGAAFVGHPDNESWGCVELEERFERDWFDPDGFMMARGGDGDIVGACWTKMHPGSIGEIYLVAVHPQHQGRGLGRWLTLSGLEYMRSERGAVRGMLYAEASNEAALGLYLEVGFEVVRVKRLFERQ